MGWLLCLLIVVGLPTLALLPTIVVLVRGGGSLFDFFCLNVLCCFLGAWPLILIYSFFWPKRLPPEQLPMVRRS